MDAAMKATDVTEKNEDIEIRLLLEALYQQISLRLPRLLPWPRSSGG